MKFKSREVEDQFRQMHPKLQVIAYSIDAYMQHHFGVHLIITSIHRTNSGIHKAWRAFDMRYNLKVAQWNQLVKWANAMFKYSKTLLTFKDERKKPKKPSNWSAPHGHIQVNYRNGENWV